MRRLSALLLAACGTAAPMPVAPPAVAAVLPLAPPRRIVSSDQRDCVIRDGGLACWSLDTPAVVQRFEHAVSISARDDANCVVMEDGGIGCFDPALLVWSAIGERVWSDITDVVRMATPCALRGDGSVECVPAPRGPSFASEYDLFRSPYGPLPRTRLDLPRVVDLAASEEHVCFVLEDGGIACLDRGYEPTRLDGLPSAARVFVGDGCGEPVCALSSEGLLTCVPVGARVAHREAIELDGIVDASLYGCMGCVVSMDGRVACFGSLDARAPFSSPPVLVDGLAHVVEISVGRDHVCALHEDESVSCFTPGGPFATFSP